jgi:hypothetical protein
MGWYVTIPQGNSNGDHNRKDSSGNVVPYGAQGKEGEEERASHPEKMQRGNADYKRH